MSFALSRSKEKHLSCQGPISFSWQQQLKTSILSFKTLNYPFLQNAKHEKRRQDYFWPKRHTRGKVANLFTFPKYVSGRLGTTFHSQITFGMVGGWLKWAPPPQSLMQVMICTHWALKKITWTKLLNAFLNTTKCMSNTKIVSNFNIFHSEIFLEWQTSELLPLLNFLWSYCIRVGWENMTLSVHIMQMKSMWRNLMVNSNFTYFQQKLID